MCLLPCYLGAILIGLLQKTNTCIDDHNCQVKGMRRIAYRIQLIIYIRMQLPCLPIRQTVAKGFTYSIFPHTHALIVSFFSSLRQKFKAYRFWAGFEALLVREQ